MKMMGDPELEKTIEFVLIFDKLFDCLNVSNLDSGKHSRNPFKSPYRSATDFRIKASFSKCNMHVCIYMDYIYIWVCKKNLLDIWTSGRQVLKLEKNKMMLSQETRSSLHLTGNHLRDWMCV